MDLGNMYKFVHPSQTHECINWDWARAIPRKGIHNGDFLCSVFKSNHDDFCHSWRLLISPCEFCMLVINLHGAFIILYFFLIFCHFNLTSQLNQLKCYQAQWRNFSNFSRAYLFLMQSLSDASILILPSHLDTRLLHLYWGQILGGDWNKSLTSFPSLLCRVTSNKGFYSPPPPPPTNIEQIWLETGF
jgi:hypothetical protein